MLERLRWLDDAALAEWRRFRRSETAWHWVSDLVVRRPAQILVATLLVLSVPLLALPGLQLSHDELADLPAGAPSVQGFDAVSEHIPPGELGPIILVIDGGDAEVWEPEAFYALGLLSENLKKVEGVTTVRSVAMPTNGRPPEDVSGAAADRQITSLTSQLSEAADGARRIADGVGQLEAGLGEIDRRLPELLDGLQRARDGSGQIADGAREAIDGVGQLRAGVGRARDGVGRLRDGLAELRSGLEEARDGTVTLRDEVAEPTEDALVAGYDALFSMSVGRTDPMYEPAIENVGEAYARVTGEYPPGHPQAGQPVREGYEGLPEALDRLADGLGEAVDGVDRLDQGLAELDSGLGRIDGGLAELEQGLERLADGAGRLEDGLGEAVGGVQRLMAGIDEALQGIRNQLLPGTRRLADGLQQGVERIRSADLGALLPGGGAGPFTITAGILEAMPDVKDQLDLFVSEDGSKTRVFIGMESPPFDRSSIDTVPEIQRITERSLHGSPLEDARVLPTGTAAFFDDVDDISSRDFRLIIVAVIVGIFLVLALLLRSLVAPLYMVASVLLSFGVALGITTFVFQDVLGAEGLAWWLPSFLFVLLVALGVDYNIFLMSRVREEAGRRPTDQAVATGLRLTGGVITSAGLILAGTFAALMAAPLRSLAQMGFAVTVGILLDTFVVRTFLVPSLAVLLGRWNWWPSARFRAEPS